MVVRETRDHDNSSCIRMIALCWLDEASPIRIRKPETGNESALIRARSLTLANNEDKRY